MLYEIATSNTMVNADRFSFWALLSLMSLCVGIGTLLLSWLVQKVTLFITDGDVNKNLIVGKLCKLKYGFSIYEPMTYKSMGLKRWEGRDGRLYNLWDIDFDGYVVLFIAAFPICTSLIGLTDTFPNLMFTIGLVVGSVFLARYVYRISKKLAKLAEDKE